MNQTEQKPISTKVNLKAMAEFEPEPYDFVLPGFQRGDVGGLFSPGGVGKSLMSMQTASLIACSAAGGKNFMGMEITAPGRVVYLAGEDRQLSLHHRFHDMMRMFSQGDRELVYKNLDLHAMADCDRDIMNLRWAGWLIKEATGARLIVIDTLSRFHFLDENDTMSAKLIMRRLELIAKKTNASVLFAHHVSKSSVSSGTADTQQAARGSSVFVDDARWGSFMSVMSAPEAKALNLPASEDRRRYVRWNICKQNYSAPLPDLWLRRERGGILVKADFGAKNIKSEENRYKEAAQSVAKSEGIWNDD